MASMRSRHTFQRRLNGVPWFSISSAFQPPPMPKIRRPLDNRSTDATSLAIVIGSRSITRQMPLPILMVVVTAAAAVSATNRSCVCQYSLGRSPPPGNGLLRLAGMWVCSGNQIDSKPRASHSLASVSGRTA